MTIFYVYEHWRPDTDICFWVGKGSGNRAYNFRRNPHYNNVIKKLSRLGMCVEVRLVESGMTEKGALALEVQRIAFWRSAGIELTNYTNGGEGVSGLRHSEETRAKIREKRKNQSRAAHSAVMKGRKHSEQHRQKISDGLKGRIFSPASREKIAQSHRGKKRPPEARENMRRAQLGKKQTQSTIRKRQKAIKKYWETASREERASLTKAGFTPEVRAYLSEKQKQRYLSPEARAQARDNALRQWAKRREAEPCK